MNISITSSVLGSFPGFDAFSVARVLEHAGITAVVRRDETAASTYTVSVPVSEIERARDLV